MSFDSFIDSFSQSDKNSVDSTPEMVKETFNYGQKLIARDYLPQISKIKELAPYLKGVTQMNLYIRGWRFQFGTSKSWAGLCAESEKTTRIGVSEVGKNIFVSIEIVKHDLNWKQNMSETVNHEIAHAIVREIFSGRMSELHRIDDQNRATQGHGRIWKQICAALCGHECRIKYENSNFAESFKEYKYTCFNCGHVGYGDYRGFQSNCEKCKKAVITEGNI